jgi:hypothetical protein
LTEERLRRAPDGRWAVFSELVSCRDDCRAEIWLLGRDGSRRRIAADASPAIDVAWRPDGAAVAIGSTALYVVALPDGRTVVADRLTSPAYARDGTLFARGLYRVPYSDGVYVWTEQAPQLLFVPPASRRAVELEDGAGYPAAVRFEDDDRVVSTTFTRAGWPVTIRVDRRGRVLRGQPARAP